MTTPESKTRDGSDRKIITKINKCMAEGKPFYSFEFFPPKTEAGVINLYSRLERMSTLGPLFMDCTWGAGGSTADLTLEISGNAQSYCATEVMMHLTCTNMPVDKVREALNRAKKSGIRNILALRGDPPKGQDQWVAVDEGFAHAVDLVKFIRAEFGDYFGIAVAGYPEAHITATSLDEDIRYTKQKVDAGADFIITQLFYDVDLFLTYVRKCREAGITCPIIPGIMPIQNYSGFKRMTTFCKTFVPQDINDALEPIKNDDARVKKYGIELGIETCKKLLANGVQGLHFYTLNLEKSVTSILAGLGFLVHEPDSAGAAPDVDENPHNTPYERGLPWVPSRLVTRKKEEVRPIFWANRPNSYLMRTHTWDEFPNGRWGDATSPAFGDLSDYHLCSFKTGSVEERRRIWGEQPTRLEHVYAVFDGYISGTVPRLPWCENALLLETHPIKPKLQAINRAGFLTINSQPQVNGAPSNDSAVGWGGPGGYVYQKAYLEFFCSAEHFHKLRSAVERFPTLSYHAVNSRGESFTNMRTEKGINAVTWGVFPDKEIAQPTVVDPTSFMYWKDEAFALWKSQWLNIYAANSPSAQLIQSVVDTFFLVNIVENDYIKGDIFAIFDAIMS